MDRTTQRAIDQLVDVYARYFVEDHAIAVISQLKGSYPVDETALRAFLATRSAELAPKISLSANSVNDMTRFVYECAEYAITNELADATALETWQAVSALPSAHSGELAKLAYGSAMVYRDVVEKTILGTLVQDARTAVDTIAQSVQNRVSSTDTGGTVQAFTWGILGNGLWLNQALTHAFDTAAIFRPGDAPVAYHADVAMDFARPLTKAPALSRDDRGLAAGGLDLVFAQVKDRSIDAVQEELTALLFTPGALTNQFALWEKTMPHAAALVDNVGKLSELAKALDLLTTTAKSLDDESPIAIAVRQRLVEMNSLVMLVLAGYEVLRETKFANTLIMAVNGQGDDPTVDVLVNSDTLTAYQAAGGDEEDLVHFGLHLDPRKGMSPAPQGWSTQHVLARRDAVIPQVIASEQDRLAQRRRNDTAMIQTMVTTTVNELAESYLSASALEALPISVLQKIDRLGLRVAKGEPDLDMTAEITTMLSGLVGDRFVQEVSDRLIRNLQHDAKNGSAYTIAETALHDAIQWTGHNTD